MIRPLHPTDILRRAFFNGLERVNRAQRLDELVKNSPSTLSIPGLSKEALSFHRKSLSLVGLSQGRLTGLASAQERAGPKAWEVVNLLLPQGNQEEGCELLEHLGQEAAQRGAERLFLRLRRGDTATNIARQAGFFSCFLEFLYLGQVPRSTTSPDSMPPLRPRTPNDDHSLFRLYNAVTPPKVRTALGLTLEEWKESQERPSGSYREVVSEANGTITTWLKTTLHSKLGQLNIIVHPDEGSRLGDLVDYGLGQLGQRASAAFMVQEYQASLPRLVEERGFRRVSEYHFTVKVLAGTVKDKSAARARGSAYMTQTSGYINSPGARVPTTNGCL